MNISETVAAILENRGWTHDKLAAESGVSQPTISRIVSGLIKNPNWDTVQKLLAFSRSKSKALLP